MFVLFLLLLLHNFTVFSTEVILIDFFTENIVTPAKIKKQLNEKNYGTGEGLAYGKSANSFNKM
jgi:hypothetical protein